MCVCVWGGGGGDMWLECADVCVCGGGGICGSSVLMCVCEGYTIRQWCTMKLDYQCKEWWLTLRKNTPEKRE